MADSAKCCFVFDDLCVLCGTVQRAACSKVAEWHIAWGDSPDDYTLACAEHVGALLVEGKANSVYPYYEDKTLKDSPPERL